MTHILITGGAGFIGSHFVRLIHTERPDWRVTVLDKLTYAGNPANLVEHEGKPGYRFIKGDICNTTDIELAFDQNVDIVVNFAAETHVDRSISTPKAFLETDIAGTFNLLSLALEKSVKCFLQISTDEVYGSISEGSATEASILNPTNPYSASKASGDLLALSFYRTYGFPVMVSRSSNNYGTHQYPEKLLPLFITNAIEGEALPLYGTGDQIRDWLHVKDNCRALLLVIEKGLPGEVYNIAGDQERRNIEMAKRIVQMTGVNPDLIRHISDRPGHDFRYSVNCDKVKRLGYSPAISLEVGLQEVFEWYKNNRSWWEPIKSGQFKEYYRKHYSSRLEVSS